MKKTEQQKHEHEDETKSNYAVAKNDVSEILEKNKQREKKKQNMNRGKTVITYEYHMRHVPNNNSCQKQPRWHARPFQASIQKCQCLFLSFPIQQRSHT